jgi:hypothetical protein
MKNKKINEGPVPTSSTKKTSSSVPTSSSSWLDPMTGMLNKAKSDAMTPVDKMHQGMPGGTEPGSFSGTGTAGTYVAWIGSILAVLGGAAMVVIAKSKRANRLLKSLSSNVESNPKLKAKMAREFNRNTEKIMNLIDKRISKGTINRRLAKTIGKDPEAAADYLYRTGQLPADQYNALIELLRSSGSARLEVVKATTKIAYDNYKSGKWTWEKSSMWLDHLDDVRPGYVKKLKQEADQILNAKRGTRITSKLPQASSQKTLDQWRLSDIGKKLAPAGSTLRKYTPKATSLADFEFSLQKYKKSAADFFGKDSQQFLNIRGTDWFKTTGYPRYLKYLKTQGQMPLTFKNLTSFPSFTEWSNTVKIHNMHKNIWTNTEAMTQRYLEDKFIWLMSK